VTELGGDQSEMHGMTPSHDLEGSQEAMVELLQGHVIRMFREFADSVSNFEQRDRKASRCGVDLVLLEGHDII